MAQGTGRELDGGRDSARDAGRVGDCVAVVPAYRSEATLARTLQSIVLDNADAIGRVVVVCSPAGDREQVRIAERFPRVSVVTSRRRLSAGAARNLGVRHAGKPDYLLFVDADCRLPWGAARALLDESAGTSAGCLGASILPSRWTLTATVRHLLEFKDSEPGVPQTPSWMVPSATMLCERRAFEAAAGFPDLWPGEDLVFCRRLVALGYAVRRSPRVVVRHAHPPGVGELLTHQLHLGRSSARARLSVDMPGTVFARRPWLAPALFVGRFARGLTWLLRYRPIRLPILILLSPLYLGGLAAWTVGFTAEAGREWASGDDGGSHTQGTGTAATAVECGHRALEHT